MRGWEVAVADLVAARAAKAHLLQQLAGAPGVNGVGLTRRRGEYLVKVGLVAAAGCDVPAEVDGVPVVVEVVGAVRALPGGTAP